MKSLNCKAIILQYSKDPAEVKNRKYANYQQQVLGLVAVNLQYHSLKTKMYCNNARKPERIVFQTWTAFSENPYILNGKVSYLYVIDNDILLIQQNSTFHNQYIHYLTYSPHCYFMSLHMKRTSLVVIFASYLQYIISQVNNVEVKMFIASISLQWQMICNCVLLGHKSNDCFTFHFCLIVSILIGLLTGLRINLQLISVSLWIYWLVYISSSYATYSYKLTTTWVTEVWWTAVIMRITKTIFMYHGH